MVCPHAYRIRREGPPIDPETPIELVVFDMDGVLIDVGSSWRMVHQHFGTHNDDAMARYLAGEIDDHEFIAHDVRRWNAAHADGRVHIDTIHDVLRIPPLMTGAHETIETLHDQGIATAIVSGGLEPMARAVGDALGIDTVYANGLVHDDEGYLTGEGILRTPLNDKAVPVRAILDDMGYRAERSAAVGNSCPDVSMFEHVGHGIAFNADDDCVRHGADHEIPRNDLRGLLAVLGLPAPQT